MDETWPTNRWFVTRLMLRIADAAMLVVTWLLVQAVFFAPTLFGGDMNGQAANVGGIPSGIILEAFGVAGVVIGWVWIHRIARGEPEPEANDRFWWSRT